MNIKALFTGDYEATSELINKDAKCGRAYGYEELHLSDETINQLKNGKDLVVDVQGGEYVLRIMYEDKSKESEDK